MNWQAADVMALLYRQRHDFLNHFQIIGAYLQLNKSERALAYLKKSLAGMEHIGRLMHLKQNELALISLIKIEAMADKGITLELEVHTMMEKLLPEVSVVIPVWAAAWDAALALACAGNILKVSLTYKENHYCLDFTTGPAAKIPPEIPVLKNLADRSGVTFNFDGHQGKMSLLFQGSCPVQSDRNE